MYKLFYNRLRLYPIILFMSWVPLTIDKIYNQLSNGKVSFYLLVINILLTHAIGFTNAIVYGYYYGLSIKDCCGRRNSILLKESKDNEIEGNNCNTTNTSKNNVLRIHHDDILRLKTESFVSKATDSLLHN